MKPKPVHFGLYWLRSWAVSPETSASSCPLSEQTFASPPSKYSAAWLSKQHIWVWPSADLTSAQAQQSITALFHIILLPCATQALHRTKLHLSNSPILQLEPRTVTLKTTFPKWIQPSPLLTANPNCSNSWEPPQVTAGTFCPQGLCLGHTLERCTRTKADRRNPDWSLVVLSCSALVTFASNYCWKEFSSWYKSSHCGTTTWLFQGVPEQRWAKPRAVISPSFPSCEPCTWHSGKATTGLGMKCPDKELLREILKITILALAWICFRSTTRHELHLCIFTKIICQMS